MIVVGGPTASGKSGMAVGIALAVGGEIISADAMSIWRGFDIGAAKPTREEMRGVPHHMIDIADPQNPFTVADYRLAALKAMDEVRQRGNVPIVCGGTGLYIRALLRPMGFGQAAGDDAVRASWENFAKEHGNAALHAQLAQRDVLSAARLHPNDVRRIVRALEVFTLTGTSISAQADDSALPPGTLFLAIQRDRAELIARIDARVEAMMRMGLLEEVTRLRHAVADDTQAMQGIGYKQLAAHLRGEMPLHQAVELTKIATRQYAKRQMTWLRGESGVTWQLPGELDMVATARSWLAAQRRAT